MAATERTDSMRRAPTRSGAAILDWTDNPVTTDRRRGAFASCRAELMCEIEILLLQTGLRDAIRLALLSDLVRRTEGRMLANDGEDRMKDRQDFRLALAKDLRRLLRRYRGAACAHIIDVLLTKIAA